MLGEERNSCLEKIREIKKIDPVVYLEVLLGKGQEKKRIVGKGLEIKAWGITSYSFFC